ncbi:carboxymuconolactone decarboxylase family protein [Oxyplasma meridianum]|uniref:Carboxymuconolactone decarboxylase family protein n=1 Tax=Oxyplasma meridianum TaxID=3073602 RepID=A0AAX4NDV0_9ARCH
MTETLSVKKVNEIGGLFKELSEKMPKETSGFMEFNKAVLTPGKLSMKEKELIAVSLAVATQCEWCIPYHVKNALESGATEEEILESSYIAALMKGAPALMQINIVLEAIKEFSIRK